jgi:hypothetical protein
LWLFAPASTTARACRRRRHRFQRIQGALEVARFSRERPQLVKASIDLIADRVD